LNLNPLKGDRVVIAASGFYPEEVDDALVTIITLEGTGE
jgi:hypothetical protein